ncbi:MAG TPA: flagellar basal body P-ring formation chaperone FlgA [Tepidisphaeraceae bacterium]
MVPPTGSQRRTMRLVLLLILMAMTAHLCSAQLAQGGEKFISPSAQRGVMVEIRREATIIGNEIRLRQIARWSDADKDVLEPIADLVVDRIEKGSAFRGIAINELKKLLSDAGINVTTMNFVGAATCTVNRSDVTVAPAAAMMQWQAAAAPQNAKPALHAAAEAADASEASEAPTDAPAGSRSLRQALIADLADRLHLPADTLQVAFRGKDEKVLSLLEPLVSFTIDPQRTGNLGEVSWNVTLTNGTGTSRAFITATARAWQNQLIVTRPLGTRQVITAEDVTEKRTLADRLTSDPILTREQVVGQMASRELRPGALLTARTVDPVQLVRTGQFVSITHAQGGVNVKISARALEGGTFGQSIRVQNELTREQFRVTITGPCEASINPPQSAAKE